MQAYCVYCRSKTRMVRVKAIEMKNGKRATLGVCSLCGNTMFRVGRTRSTTEQIRAS